MWKQGSVYIVVTLSVILALAARLALVDVLGQHAPFMFFFLVIAIITLWAGTKAGLYATALGGLVSAYFFLEPAYTFSVTNIQEQISFMLYLLVGTAISLVGSAIYQAKQHLRSANERYEVFIDQSTEGIWRFELEEPISINLTTKEKIEAAYKYGYLAECNKAFAAMYGFSSPKEIIGARLADLLPRNENNLEFLTRFIENNYRLENAESHEKHNEGDELYISNNLVGVIEDGKLLRAWGVQRNITEQKRIEKELAESQERLMLAINGSNEGVWDWNITTGEIYWSDLLKEQLGYSKDFKPNFTDWENSLHPDDKEKAKQAIDDHLSGKTEYYNLVVRDRTLSGEWRWALARGVAQRDKDGKPIRLVGTRTDITERVKVKEDLELALKRAEDANRAKSEFLANMSHEIRTPMNAVVGIANILEWSSPLTDKQKECISTLKISAASLLSLINDLLDISKIESKALNLEKIDFRLDQLVSEVLKIQAHAANKKGLLLSSQSKLTHNSFSGDKLRIQQIISNLVSNAIKFTHAGEVKVTLSEVPGVGNNPSIVRISVKDTGIGIEKEKLEAVFDKFVQSDMSTTRKYGGTGLGLTICKHLAELMNGDIRVESEVKKGSTFTLDIPLMRAEQENSPPADKTSNELDGNQQTILLIEDSEANIYVATTWLKQFGFNCDVAENGIVGYNKWSNSPGSYALILMDIQMPVLDGYEVTKKIRQEELNRKLPRTPIVGITAHAGMDAKNRCIHAGMDNYVSKPFIPDHLQEVLTKTLSLNKAG